MLIVHQIKASDKEIQNSHTNQKVNLLATWKKKYVRDVEPNGHFFFRRRLTTMQKIQIKVEQMSKQAFIEGWNKADPQIVNQIANLWYPKKISNAFFTICLFNGTMLIVFSQPVSYICKMFSWFVTKNKLIWRW